MRGKGWENRLLGLILLHRLTELFNAWIAPPKSLKMGGEKVDLGGFEFIVTFL